MTILAGSPTVTITVMPIDDSAVEEDETVVVMLASGTGYTVGALSSDTVTVVDNDSPLVTIVATDNTAMEAGPSTGFFTVSRTGPATSALTVNYTVGGTATNSMDYINLPDSVTIPAGSSMAAPIMVSPVDDALIESNETVVVTLASGAGYTVGVPSSDTVTITDNDLPVVMIVATDDTATEAWPTNGQYTVSRTGATTLALTVNFTVGGTATSGSDYTGIGASATIPAGAAIVLITVTPINDSIDENDETVVVTLAANAAYTLGNPSSATVTIQDDDTAGVTVTPTSGLVTTEAGGMATFTIKLNSQPTANVIIGLNSSDTTEGTVSPASVTFTAPNWNTAQTVTGTGVDDSIVDGNVA